ncbi:MAG: AAA family ATPase [Alphaproteobacteria bacterium]|nr:AAA family ATPase [Alphaproteobacteria bacterium]
MSILDLATPVSDTVESVNMIVYGDSGVGKTVFSGSGRDKGKNDLILAVEHGTSSAGRAGSKANVLTVRKWTELVEAIDELIEDPDRFDWVIVDSLTKVQDLIWEHIIGEARRNNPGRNVYARELQEWGAAQLMLTEVVERLNGSEVNVIYTALAELGTDEEAQEFKLPSIHGKGGKLAAWVCAQADVVAYMSVGRTSKGTEYRKFQFNKSPEVFAKDRFNLFPGKPVANVTLEKFTDKLLEGNVETPEATENTPKKESN